MLFYCSCSYLPRFTPAEHSGEVTHWDWDAVGVCSARVVHRPLALITLALPLWCVAAASLLSETMVGEGERSWVTWGLDFSLRQTLSIWTWRRACSVGPVPSPKDTQLCSECGGGPGRRELPALLHRQSVFSSVPLSRISYFSSVTERFPPHPWHCPALAMMPLPAAQYLCLGPQGMRAGSCAHVSWKGAPPGPWESLMEPGKKSFWVGLNTLWLGSQGFTTLVEVYTWPLKNLWHLSCFLPAGINDGHLFFLSSHMGEIVLTFCFPWRACRHWIWFVALPATLTLKWAETALWFYWLPR